ncbi:hypothetical protein [Rhodovulum iodosum]|uniref:hypothetical protein n=1 Tax=Rhodovulum iodosum TaxID=68291 RepID=UPI00319E65F3
MVVWLIATPSLLLPGVTADATQVVALVAIFAAALTIFEYSAESPVLVEFRDAPPFNRIRFVTMFLTVFLLSVITRGQSMPTPFTEFVAAIGALVAQATDFPYSPVRLLVLALPPGTEAHQVMLVRTAAGLAYLISLLSLAIFVALARARHWPSHKMTFNVWVNLPTFDPTAGGDVVKRLARDARFNVALGFLLPFLIPVAFKASSYLFSPVTLTSAQTMIWTVSAWALLPASLFMRGIAIGRIAELIEDQRRRAEPAKDDEKGTFVPA